MGWTCVLSNECSLEQAHRHRFPHSVSRGHANVKALSSKSTRQGQSTTAANLLVTLSMQPAVSSASEGRGVYDLVFSFLASRQGIVWLGLSSLQGFEFESVVLIRGILGVLRIAHVAALHGSTMKQQPSKPEPETQITPASLLNP